MPGAIVGSVRVTPASAQPGESVLVEALAPDGSPLDPSIPIAINGVRGGRQFVQFADPGTFAVEAVAVKDGSLEQASAQVQVQAPDWPEVAAPAEGAQLALPSDVRRLPLLTSTRTPTDRSPYRVQLSAVDTDHFVANLARQYAAPAPATVAQPTSIDDALAVTTYAWDFGDGTTATTPSALVEHDYFGALAPEQEHHLFDVTCTLQTKSGTSFSVKRTMSVVNAYAVCRNRGVIAPPIIATTHARKSMGTFGASVVVQNLEDFPVTLTQRRFTYEMGGTETVTGWETLATPLTLPAKAQTAISMSVPFATVPAGVPAFSVLFVGDDGQGRTVHIELALDVALPDHRSSGLRFGRVALTTIAAHGFESIAGALGSPHAQPQQPQGGGHGGFQVGGGLHHGVNPGEIQVEGGGLHHGGLLGGVAPGAVEQGVQGVAIQGAAQGGVLHQGGQAGVLQHAGVQIGQFLQEEAFAGVDVAQLQAHDATIGALTAQAAPAPELQTRQFDFAAVADVHESVFVRAAGDLATIASEVSPAVTAAPIDAVLAREDIGSALVAGSQVDLDALAGIVGEHDRPAAASAFATIADLAKQWKSLLTGPVEGQPCDPDNRPDGIDDQWACQIQVTNGQPEMITWHRHARFDNARKGDLLLAPGGPSGIIGGLLRQVQPPQHYAHIGIMTRNGDMVTHSTFSEKRLNAHPNGSVTIPLAGSEPAPTDGFEPNVLKYGWPGVITQWISGAVDTGNFADLANMPNPGDAETEKPAVDPDGQPYDDIKPFNKYSAIGDDFEIVPPLVVKPSPFEETPEIRQRLHALADAALAETGKSHYRFYCYTDPTIGLTSPEPPGNEWYSGTYPTVCSSFIWVLMSRLGYQMEGPGGVEHASDLEPVDVAMGAEVTEGARDGLYLYHADERRTAGAWLHERLASMVMDQLKEKARAKVGSEKLAGILGGLIDLFSDISDDVANQMCNAFAWDWTDTDAKDSTKWQDVGDSLAVSPDNTMLWDPPSRGGLYGYAVPAGYVRPAVEQGPKYVWRFVPNRGTLHGQVRFMGNGVGGAMVQVADGLTAFTHSDGTYKLSNVPFGQYELKAQYDRGDGGPIPGQQMLKMSQVDQAADFDLAPPRAWYRNIHVTGQFYFMKEYVIGKNPRTDPPYDYAFDVPVTPDPGGYTARYSVHNDFHGIYGVGNFLFKWENEGVVSFQCTFAVAQDASIIEDAADALSSAVDWISLGYVGSLFGSEVKGSDSFGGTIDPNGPPAEHGFLIGDSGGTQGRLSFHIENQDLR